MGTLILIFSMIVLVTIFISGYLEGKLDTLDNKNDDVYTTISFVSSIIIKLGVLFGFITFIGIILKYCIYIYNLAIN